MEWKSEPRELPTGQRLLYQRLTWSGPVSVMIVVGDAETMLIDATAIFADGVRHPAAGFEPANLELIRHRLTAWSQWAARHPADRQPAMLRGRP